MVLTSELKDNSSAVNQFFRAYFNDEASKAFFKSLRAEQRRWDLVVESPSDLPGKSYGLVIGMAFDYVVRATTWAFDYHQTAASACIPFYNARLGFPLSVDDFEGHRYLFNGLTGEMRDYDEFRQDATDEKAARALWLMELDREIYNTLGSADILQSSIVWAWLEGLGRTGQWSAAMEEAFQNREPLYGLIKRIHPAAILDLTNLLESYQAHQRPHWHGHPVISNPKFGESAGDWVVDHTLWDMKTTKNPAKTAEHDIKQVLGYSLLDSADQHAITNMGLYYPRFAKALEWSAEALLEELSGQSHPLNWWRTRWIEALH